jgi:hypothetical protein
VTHDDIDDRDDFFDDTPMMRLLDGQEMDVDAPLRPGFYLSRIEPEQYEQDDYDGGGTVFPEHVVTTTVTPAMRARARANTPPRAMRARLVRFRRRGQGRRHSTRRTRSSSRGSPGRQGDGPEPARSSARLMAVAS